MVWDFRLAKDMSCGLGERVDKETGGLGIVVPHTTDRDIQENRRLYSQTWSLGREIDQRIIQVVATVF